MGRENDELTVRLKAVVHLVTQGRVVPAGWEALKENIKRQKTTYHISHGDIVAHVRGNVDAQVLLLPWQVEGDVVHVPGDGGRVEDTYHNLLPYDDRPFMFCIIAEFPSVKGSKA